MNDNHARVCTSPEWAEYLQTQVLTALTAGVDLGTDMLEIGPGPGAATDWLRHKVSRLTSVEIDHDAAARLRERFAGTNVDIVDGSGTELEYSDCSFDSVGCFTMLHHVPTAAGQNQILAEALRVLWPGGVFLCSDSLASTGLHDFHVGDTYNPIEPGSVISRLQTVGFGAMTVTVRDELRFAAWKPAASAAEDSTLTDGRSAVRAAIGDRPGQGEKYIRC